MSAKTALVVGLVLAGIASGQPTRTLAGRLIESSGETQKPVAGVSVVLSGLGRKAISDSDGNFHLPLPDIVGDGDEVTIDVQTSELAVLEPTGGVLVAPAEGADALQTIRLQRSGSLEFLSDAEMRRFAEEDARDSNRLPPESDKERPAPRRYAQDWAVRRGLSADQLRAALDKWAAAQTSPQASSYELSLAAFSRGDFRPAVNYALAAARDQAAGNRVSALRLAGDSAFNALDFEASANMYREALGQVVRSQRPARWADLQVRIGNSEAEQSFHCEEAAVAVHAEDARRAYALALEVYKRETAPLAWATAENNMGVALLELSKQADGKRAVTLLEQAVGAIGSTLEVRTRETSPQDWAESQNNLAAVYLDLSVRSEALVQHLVYEEQAEAAYRNALQVYTADRSPELWATAQNDLGLVLFGKGFRGEGSEAVANLERAVAAYRSALGVLSPNRLPDMWATAQSNIGFALTEIAKRTGGERAISYLQSAVAAHRDALSVRTREHQPHEWAETQGGLVDALVQLASLSMSGQGSGANTYLEEALAAFRSALPLISRESRPQQWALGQIWLGLILSGLGDQRQGASAPDDLRDGVTALGDGLNVLSREEYPHDWAVAQYVLGNALRELAEKGGGPRAPEYLARSADANRSALQFYTREQTPEPWAKTENNLGAALAELAQHRERAEAVKLDKEALTAFQSALQVRSEQSSPSEWFDTMVNIALTYEAIGDRANALSAYKSLLRHDPGNPDLRAKIEALTRAR